MDCALKFDQSETRRSLEKLGERIRGLWVHDGARWWVNWNRGHSEGFSEARYGGLAFSMS